MNFVVVGHAGAWLHYALAWAKALRPCSKTPLRPDRSTTPLKEPHMSGAANPVQPLCPCEGEDPEKLAEFEQRITDGVHIEPGDWMPEAYRMGMIGMAEHHANSEIIGALPEGEWITRAPSLRRKLALTAKVQDEVGHGQMLYRVSQELGKSRDDMLRDLITGKTKYHHCFNYPAPDVGRHCHDSVAYRRRGHHEPEDLGRRRLRPVRAHHEPHQHGRGLSLQER